MKVDNRHSRFFWDRVGYAMIFSFHVGLTDSVMQRMQFFLSVSVRHFLVTELSDLLFLYS
jgi:hypothetical protein